MIRFAKCVSAAIVAAVVFSAASASAALPPTEVKVPKSLWDKTPYKDAKVGDWAEYEAVGGVMMRKEVTEAGDHFVTIATTTVISGMKFPAGAVKMVFSEPDPAGTTETKTSDGSEVKTSEVKVKVGDKEITATLTEVVKDGKTVAKSWTSKEVPMDGLVRAEGPDGNAAMVLKAFGRK